jgi:hypothetical protein
MELISAVEASSTAAPQRVWDRLADGLHWSDWSSTVEWMVVEGPFAPGSFVTVKRKRARQTAYHMEEAEAPKRLALMLTFGRAAQLRIAWTLEPQGEGTRIRQTIESGGPLRRWLTDPQAKRGAIAWAGDPARLAELAATP